MCVVFSFYMEEAWAKALDRTGPHSCASKIPASNQWVTSAKCHKASNSAGIVKLTRCC